MVTRERNFPYFEPEHREIILLTRVERRELLEPAKSIKKERDMMSFLTDKLFSILQLVLLFQATGIAVTLNQCIKADAQGRHFNLPVLLLSRRYASNVGAPGSAIRASPAPRNSKNRLPILHTNIRSVLTKVADLGSVTDSSTADVIALPQTQLWGDMRDSIMFSRQLTITMLIVANGAVQRWGGTSVALEKRSLTAAIETHRDLERVRL